MLVRYAFYFGLPTLFFITVATGLGNTLGPLVFAFILAYFVFPLVLKLESVGLKRSMATAMIFSTITILVIISAITVAPLVIGEFTQFWKELPQNVGKVITWVNERLASTDIEAIKLDKEFVLLHVKKIASKISIEVVQGISKFIGGTFSGAAQLIIGVTNLFLFPIFFFYIITVYEKIVSNFKDLIPQQFIGPLSNFSESANRIFSGYVRGQLIVASILAIFYGLGLLIFGLRFGLIIGLLTGLLVIIPFVGYSLGLMTAIIMCLATSAPLYTWVGVGLVFSIGQVLESFVLTPKIVGNKVGLHPFITMLAIIIGGNLLGLIGMFLAIPIAAICQVLSMNFINLYRKSDVYKEPIAW